MSTARRVDLHAALRDPRRYRRQIDRLHERYLATRHLYELQQDEVSLASFVLQKRTVARLMAHTVGHGDYALGPATLRTIWVDGKSRLVFAYRLTDLLVHGVVADIIEDATAPTLSPSLYSYRKGVSWWQPVASLGAYVREHRQARPDPRTRGLYVVRRDIDSYTDSIPVGSTSPLWTMVRSALGSSERALGAADWRLVETVIRPEAFQGASGRFTVYRGVPTGQPISCVLFNFYLRDLDTALDRVPGAFYARYCDDLVFAHPEPDVVRAADARIQQTLAALGLALNPKKSRTLYLTAAGRPPEAQAGFKGTTTVPFLGCLVSGHGTVALSREKRRRFLADLDQRAQRTASALGRAHRRPGPVVCAVINRALRPRVEPVQQRAATLLRRAVTDREHLKQLDYWIARIVLAAVTGEKSARAFRTVPYRTIRRDWKLTSLVHARNRWARGVAPARS